MLTSSRQGRQGTGFTNRVQLQETICDKTYGFQKPGLKTGVVKGVRETYRLEIWSIEGYAPRATNKQ